MKVRDILDFLKKEKIAFEFKGNESADVFTFSSINNLKPHSVSWVKNANYIDVSKIEALMEKNVTVLSPFEIEGVNSIVVDYPKRAFFSVLETFFSNSFEHTVSEKATVLTKKIGTNVHVGPNSFIGEQVEIGDNTVIYPNVSITCPCKIGKDCIIWSGTSIGTDGFGYFYDEDNIPQKVIHYGGVFIGDRVEIGANCNIARGTIDDTVIEDDVKLDSLAYVAHNAKIGKGTVIIGFSEMAGSSKVGSRSYLSAHVFVKNQVSVGSNTFIGQDVMVSQDVENDMIVLNGSKPIERKNKNYRRFL